MGQALSNYWRVIPNIFGTIIARRTFPYARRIIEISLHLQFSI